VNETSPHLDIRWVLGVLRRRGLLILAAVAAVFVLVYALSSTRDKVYTSNADVQFTGATQQLLTESGDRPSNRNINLANEVYLVTSATVREAVVAQLGSDAYGEVRNIGVVQVTNTDVMRISVSSTSPEIARDAADAFANNYTEIRKRDLQEIYTRQAEALRNTSEVVAEEIVSLEQAIANDPNPNSAENEVRRLQRGSLISQQSSLQNRAFELDLNAAERASTIRVAKSAGLPRLPNSPTPLRDAGIAALATLVIGIGLAFLYEQLDTRIKADNLAAVTGSIPLLGSLPVIGTRRRFLGLLGKRGAAPRELVPATSAAAEAYRAIATSLRFSALGQQKRRILITSSISGEGKTSLTANLAAILAENGLRVLVVSGDLRRPQLAQTLGAVDIDKGLTSVILGDEQLVDVLVSAGRSDEEAITILPSGPLPHDPSVLLGSDEFGEMLTQFEKAGADFILIDCAPVLPVSDPLAVARHVDGVILVVEHGRSRQGELAQAIERLQKVDADVIGVVINAVPGDSDLVYMGNYGYSAPA